MVMAKPEQIVSTCSHDKIPPTVLLLTVPPEQCRKPVQEVHEVSGLASGPFKVPTAGDDLMEHPHPSLHLMENNRQVQAGHACSKQCLLHVSVILLDPDYIGLKPLFHPLSLEFTLKILYGLLNPCCCGIIGLFSQLPDTFLIQSPFRLESSKGTKNNAA